MPYRKNPDGEDGPIHDILEETRRGRRADSRHTGVRPGCIAAASAGQTGRPRTRVRGLSNVHDNMRDQETHKHSSDIE